MAAWIAQASQPPVLTWDPSSSPDIAGYRLYAGVRSGSYDATYEVGNTNLAAIPALQFGRTNYLAVTAYSTACLESDYSKELPLKPEPPAAWHPMIATLEDTPVQIDLTIASLNPANYEVPDHRFTQVRPIRR